MIVVNFVFSTEDRRKKMVKDVEFVKRSNFS